MEGWASMPSVIQTRAGLNQTVVWAAIQPDSGSDVAGGVKATSDLEVEGKLCHATSAYEEAFPAEDTGTRHCA